MTGEILKNIDDLEKHLTKAKTNNSDFQRAIYYHNQHLDIAHKIDNKAGDECAYGNLGNAYDSLDKFQEAINYHNQHLSIAQKSATGPEKDVPIAISAMHINPSANSKKQ